MGSQPRPRCGIFCSVCDCGRRQVPCLFKKHTKPLGDIRWAEFSLLYTYASIRAMEINAKDTYG
jgi:hypothetical protein